MISIFSLLEYPRPRMIDEMEYSDRYFQLSSQLVFKNWSTATDSSTKMKEEIQDPLRLVCKNV